MWMDEFRQRTRWHAHANARQYTAPADPFELVHVDPARVDRYTTVSLKWGFGRVRGGDWDRPENCRSIEDLYIYTGLVERFEAGADWEETAYYEHVTERIEAGGFRRCESVTALDDTVLPAVEALYDDMRENGYRPNLGVVYDTVSEFDSIHELEPLVLIGRNGEVIWSEGYHRFALARILGIEAVPVYVVRRHEQWQHVRDRVAAADGVPTELDDYTNHPDLQDIGDG